jgi:uncharacterized protein (UPF0335 family)
VQLQEAVPRDAQAGDPGEEATVLLRRIEELEREKAEIVDQIKEVFAEDNGNGFDVAVLRKVIAMRKQDRVKRMEQEAILDLYLSAMGEI